MLDESEAHEDPHAAAVYAASHDYGQVLAGPEAEGRVHAEFWSRELGPGVVDYVRRGQGDREARDDETSPELEQHRAVSQRNNVHDSLYINPKYPSLDVRPAKRPRKSAKSTLKKRRPV